MTFIREHDGATADEMTAAMNPTAGPNAYAPVFTGLIQKDVIVRSTKQRPTRTGRMAAIHYMHPDMTVDEQPEQGELL